METKDINDNNILIAQFMGYWANDDFIAIEFGKSGSFDSLGIEDLKYHKSWDWLMEVVEKIESLGFWVNIKKNHVTIAWDNKGSHHSKMIHSEFGNQSKIQRVYNCVVEFIKYYKYKS